MFFSCVFSFVESHTYDGLPYSVDGKSRRGGGGENVLSLWYKNHLCRAALAVGMLGNGERGRERDGIGRLRKKQEQTLFNDLRRWWNNSDKVVRKISLISQRSGDNSNHECWIPPQREFIEPKSSRRKLVELHWRSRIPPQSEFMKLTYCTVDRQLSNCSPHNNKNNSHSSRTWRLRRR